MTPSVPKEVTPISQTQSPLPDPRAQTERLRAELDAVYSELSQSAVPLALIAATEVCHMRDAIAVPPETYPGLDALDKALTKALRSLVVLVGHADSAEVQQSVNTLRRVLLVDRHRFDPDPATTNLSLAIALRRLWLIPHRAELLRAQQKLQQASRALEAPGVDPDIIDNLQRTCALLKQYIITQENYGASIRQELEELYKQQLL